MERRTFLTTAAGAGSALMASTSSSMSQGCQPTEPRIYDGFVLALGGGAAKAFAHIPVLEAIDELGVKPKAIAGTSMGAILGGFYASGMSARDIRQFTVELLTQKTQLFQKLFLNGGRTWGSLLNLSRPAIIDPVVLFETVFPEGLAPSFEGLDIPLKIIATDFHKQSEVVLNSGSLLPAIAASSALPMLLTPVVIDDQVLIDGGFVNPTPFDVFGDTNSAKVAVDVTASDFSDMTGLPSGMDTWIGSVSIILHSLVAAKFACAQPDLLIAPPIGKFQTMDFFSIEDILEAAEPAKDTFKRGLASLFEDV